MPTSVRTFCRTSSGIGLSDLHHIGDFRNRAALGSSYRHQLRNPHDRALGRDRSLGKYLVYRPVVRALFALGNGRCHVELALFCRRPPRRRCPLRALRFWTSIAGADWVILNRRWDFLNELNRSTAFGSDEPNQIVRENFELWWQGGAYLLFRNKRISNAIVPPPP